MLSASSSRLAGRMQRPAARPRASMTARAMSSSVGRAAICPACSSSSRMCSSSAWVVPLQQQQQLSPRLAGPQQLLTAPGRGPIGQGMPGPLRLPIGQRQTTIMRSFLGVGAPEAILVGVVALVVFGPKGLADAAKSLGQTLRAFQPTIREVVEVSQEIKGTLEQELGLDELRNAASLRPTPRPAAPAADTPAAAAAAAPAAASGEGSEASSSSSGAVSNLQPVTEEQALQIDPDIELKRAMSEQAAWGGQPPVASSAAAPAAAAAAAAAAPAAAAASSSSSSKDLSQLSLEELEAELARRRETA